MNNNELSNNAVTIPITVDSVKQIPTYRMTRCTYFSIENSEPAPGWTLHTANVDISFFMLGLSGVILSPPGDEQFFDSPDKYDQLFQAIEKNDGFYVGMNDIWLPNDLFYREKDLQRGDVFRIGYDLFKAAYLLGDKAKSDEDAFLSLKKMEVPLVLNYSEDETDGLTLWNIRQIEINRREYHENIEKKLKKNVNSQKPSPRRF